MLIQYIIADYYQLGLYTTTVLLGPIRMCYYAESLRMVCWFSVPYFTTNRSTFWQNTAAVFYKWIGPFIGTPECNRASMKLISKSSSKKHIHKDQCINKSPLSSTFSFFCCWNFHIVIDRGLSPVLIMVTLQVNCM